MPSSQRLGKFQKFPPLLILFILTLSATCLAQSLPEQPKQETVGNFAQASTKVENRAARAVEQTQTNLKPQTQTVSVASEPNSSAVAKASSVSAGSGTGSGSGTGNGTGPGSGAVEEGVVSAKVNYNDVFFVSSVTTRPQILEHPTPGYTEEARRAQVEGAVKLSVILNADGAVSEIRVERELGFGIDEKAIEAARQLRFVPAQKDGHRVSVRVFLEFKFTLL